ncbi:glycosyltransferase family 2 protein, partial [bacterium]|nr:glycosyltransferase family 2 protein [bacterium]
VIPMFNAEPWISSTLMSVVTQTHSVSEIVVVNDGSTDNSASKAESVLASFGIDYQVATIPNGGVSRARNLGASIAAGEVLCFLDADDLWEPDKVLRQLELLESAELQA